MRIIGLLATTLFLMGCAEGFVTFPTEEGPQQERLENVDIVRLSSANIAGFSATDQGHTATNMPMGAGWFYTVGAGDVLQVIVFDHAELTVPGGAENGVQGFRVQSDGSINYPFIGTVQARGRRPDEIRRDIATRLAEFIPDPQVDLRVVEFNAQSVVVTGAVATPRKLPLTSVPTTLLEAVTAAGGLEDRADPTRVTVRRGGRTYRVDLAGFLQAGLARNNPVLRNGDIINIPPRDAQEAYLLGEVRAPGVVNLADDSVTLTQALARQGGLEEIRADARGIFVFRLVGGRETVYQLDISDPTGLLLGTRFALAPDDVIYVVRSPLTRWNDTINGLLPTVGAIRTTDGITD